MGQRQGRSADPSSFMRIFWMNDSNELSSAHTKIRTTGQGRMDDSYHNQSNAGMAGGSYLTLATSLALANPDFNILLNKFSRRSLNVLESYQQEKLGQMVLSLTDNRWDSVSASYYSRA
ncbi:hypothetical protein E2562_010707 [Oryza meyeriana var. granulata]|uniref:Uncharacterized protein n=1 Tax=Oryza meyeriana var. granulata TaxID=110450 RepID=A0A6G1EW86_9ORYZ|nr:hypothetical protein E2562_010707 [Oryza meyeriana var. granulata]